MVDRRPMCRASGRDSHPAALTDGRWLILHKSGVRKGEIIVLTIGVVIVAGWYVARARFPAQMGGPNIGAGAVLIVGYVLVLGGLAVVVGNFVAEHRRRGR